MARVKIAGTSGASENTIVFSPAGGHSHNGRNSSLIDSTAYSMYDFSPTFVGTEVNPDRAVRQENNRIAFEDVIKRVVNNSVLAPAGIRLEPGSLNGSLIIANTITANNLAANTITADEIAANTITANELSSNIVLINNRITSQNWDGTILANGTILSNNIGSTGWAITNTHAVFDSTLIRGSIAANSLVTPNLTISNTGAIISTSFNVTAGGNVTATNANITGTITSGSGSIGGWTIDTNRIYGGSTYLYSNGSMAIGATTIAANGQITNGGYTLSAAGALTATGVNISGNITATTITATTSGRIGPFDLTSTSLKSTSYNAQNYMEILDYGDMYIYSAPLSGAHAGMRYTTAMIGETIVIGRNDMATTRYCMMGGDASWGAANVGFGIVENNVSVFRVLQDGHIYCSNVTATTFNGNATSATYAVDAGYADSAGYADIAGLRLGRILDITSASVGQDFVIANGNGSGVLRVASEAGVYSKVVTGRAVQVNSSDLIGTTASTARLKQDIEAYIFDEEAVLSIEPKRFKYNEKVQHGGDDSDWQYGFIAEEAVAAGLSELCGFDEGGLPDYFAYERMCVAQQQIIRTLWAKVEGLEYRIKTLEGV